MNHRVHLLLYNLLRVPLGLGVVIAGFALYFRYEWPQWAMLLVTLFALVFVTWCIERLFKKVITPACGECDGKYEIQRTRVDGRRRVVYTCQSCGHEVDAGR